MRGPTVLVDAQSVACPLCGAVVHRKPASDASDIHALERHFATECTSQTLVGERETGPQSGGERVP